MNTSTQVLDVTDRTPETSPFDLVLVKENVQGLGMIRGLDHAGSAQGALLDMDRPDSLNHLLQQIASWIEGLRSPVLTGNSGSSTLRFGSLGVTSEWRTAVAVSYTHLTLPTKRIV